MKFRLKITLALVCLLSLLFGGGSSALISLSFQNALAREQAAAKASYDQLLHTFQLVERVEVWSQPQDAVQVVQQLSAQGGQSWAALSLTAGEDVLVTQGVPAQSFLDLSGLVDPSHCAQGAFAHYDKQYLQLTGQLDIQGSPLLLNVAYDISPIYETRQQQQEAFGKIFAALLAICALLSYTAARLLTRPLDKLAQAAQALAAGDLARRSGVTSRDEIGALAREFDAMAARQQEHIAALQATMEGQDRFIGNFTHELKTPMTSILGYADLLRGGTLDAERRRTAAEALYHESARLESLSQQLLALNGLQADGVVLRPVRVAAAFADAVRSLPDVVLDCDAPAEAVVLADRVLLADLVRNLALNAWHAGPQDGAVHLRCTDAGECWRLTVQDTGCGIPAEALPHLTEPFYRVDKARARANGGSGVGLALCAQIAEAFGTQLTFASRVGEGTTVTILLQKEAEHEEAAQQQ